MSIQKINVAGVPEHFNLPWRMLAESDLAAKLGYQVDWRDVREGTGEMIAQLRSGQCDMALLLTEGAVAGIGNGGGYRIVGEYVASPLRWGIHVAADSDIQDDTDLEGRSFAISRFGSGSHLMAALYAREQGWQTTPEYVVVDHLTGAQAALQAGKADLFLWEQFTTQPLVDEGVFRRVGVVPTPWPCFVACLSDNSEIPPVAALALLKLALATASLLVVRPNIADVFADRYQLRRSQVTEWLALTRWSEAGILAPKWIDEASDALLAVELIDTPVEPTAAIIAT
ncbi:MAG: PhnD/SsuA/transferrin family substrate-binding protein [Pseudomonadota bacterium]